METMHVPWQRQGRHRRSTRRRRRFNAAVIGEGPFRRAQSDEVACKGEIRYTRGEVALSAHLRNGAVRHATPTTARRKAIMHVSKPSRPQNTKHWYIRHRGVWRGPATEDQIQQFIAERHLGPDTLVTEQGRNARKAAEAGVMPERDGEETITTATKKANPLLAPCPDCRQEVSTLADACPNCGRRLLMLPELASNPPLDFGALVWAVLCIASLLLFVGGFCAIFSGPPEEIIGLFAFSAGLIGLLLCGIWAKLKDINDRLRN